MSIHESKEHFENGDASVLVLKVTGGWFFEQIDSLRVQVTVSGSKPALEAHIGIYGKPEGLRQLADLLTAIARIGTWHAELDV